jgi:hypothetical protein
MYYWGQITLVVKVSRHKVEKQALGRLTLFFTTVNHCHCQTHHCEMLNTEKWTTE